MAIKSTGIKKWQIDYRFSNGERRRETVVGSKKLAETVLAKRRVQIAEGKFLDIKKREKNRFEDFATQYIQSHLRVNCKNPAKSEVWVNSLKRYFSGKYLHEITPLVIENFKESRLKAAKLHGNDKPIKPTTVNKELSCLKGIFTKAIAWNKFDGQNPAKQVKPLKEPPHKTLFLEKEEIKRLLAACDGDFRPFVVFALNTGLRYSEQLSLKWKDCDSVRGIVYIYETKNGEKAEIHLNEAAKCALIAIPKQKDSPFVFCRADGNPFIRVREAFDGALKRAKLLPEHTLDEKITWHTLRHTFGSQLAMAGVDIYAIQRLMRHKSISMTMRYAHLSPSYKQRAVDALNGLCDMGNTNANMDTFWTHGEFNKSALEFKSIVTA